MKVIINSAELLPIVKKVQCIFSTSTNLTNAARLLCFDAREQLLIYAQGELDSSYEAVLNIVPDKQGLIAVHGINFFKLIKTFKLGENILLEVKDGDDKLRVKCGTSTLKLPTLSPTLIQDNRLSADDVLEDTPAFVVNTKEFIAKIKKTKNVIDPESALDALANLCLTEDKDSGPAMKLYSLNGHMFIKDRISYSEGAPEDAEYLIGKPKLEVISKIMDSEETSFYFKGKFLYVCGDNDCLITTRSLDEYPNVDNFLDKCGSEYISGECKFNKKDLLASLNRLDLIANEGIKNCARLNLAKDYITATCVSEKGDISEKIPCEYQGTIKTIVFRIRDFKDLLETFNKDELILYMTTEEGPAKIVSQDDETENYLVVLMPIKEMNSEYTEATETEE